MCPIVEGPQTVKEGISTIVSIKSKKLIDQIVWSRGRSKLKPEKIGEAPVRGRVMEEISSALLSGG